MRTTTLAAAVLAVGALAACGSSTTGAAPGTGTPAPGSASPTATAASTCADLPMVATELTRTVHYAALDVGTTNDPSRYYGRIDQAVGTLGDLTTRCSPAAAADVAALATSIGALEKAMVPGADAAAIATDVALLKAVRADGITAYTALKLPTAGWENAPENRVAG